jgi:hypothetical protein
MIDAGGREAPGHFQSDQIPTFLAGTQYSDSSHSHLFGFRKQEKSKMIVQATLKSETKYNVGPKMASEQVRVILLTTTHA